MKKICVLLLALVLLLGLAVPAAAESYDATVLFTHDLHSHLLPFPAEGGEVGGYARLMTLIRQQKEKYPNAILIDGGDFSMGSLFQTAYPTSAIELRMMGAMGYDATTFGNHEFDYLPAGLAGMLNAAVSSGDPLPALLNGNYWPEADGAAKAAMERYGVKKYILLQRGGVYFAIFGVFGEDADACAPNSGMAFEDPIATSQQIVNEAKAECLKVYGQEPIVIALSHSGTEDGKGEDYTLAEKVSGIHLIISGHTHTDLYTPIQVGGTYIVSAGEYGRNLGVVQLRRENGSVKVADYQLLPVTEAVAEDPEIAELVLSFKETVQQDYLSNYGVTFDEVLVSNPYSFDTVDQVYATAHESTLGNLFADAYKWAAEKVTGGTVDFALTASGVIRDTLPMGDVTVSNVFNAASLGVGTEGELVAVYIDGKDLRNALEVDASVYPLMKSAQLFSAGVEYSFNTNRMLFNKVDYAKLRRADGSLEDIQDDKLYCVVTGMYVGQMLGSVKEQSFGLISITPRDKDGNPIAADALENFVIRDDQGVALKEWYAIASYLQEMDGTVDSAYAQPDGRKVVYSSWAPADIFRGANVFTFAAMGLGLVVIAILVLITWLIVRRVKKHKKKKAMQQ